MSKIPRLFLLLFLVPVLIGCPEDADITRLENADQAITAEFQAFKAELKAYLVDGSPGSSTPPDVYPATMGLADWTEELWIAFCEVERVLPDVPTSVLCSPDGGTDPAGRPPPPPGL